MVEFTEIEFKYDAKNISLRDYNKAMSNLYDTIPMYQPTYAQPSGWDYYFTNNRYVARFRAGDLNEITVKKQTNSKNNFIREEVNLAIVPEITAKKTLNKATKFLELQGYKYNFAIHKISHIYYFHLFNLVYYIVKDEKMKEVGRFIEIEIKEDFNWISIQDAYNELLNVERRLGSLGLKPETRLNKSLFQMFRRGEK